MITAKFIGSYVATTGTGASKVTLKDENNKPIIHNFFELLVDTTNEEDVASMELYRLKQGTYYKENEETGNALWFPREDYTSKGTTAIKVSAKGNIYLELSPTQQFLKDSKEFGVTVLQESSKTVSNNLAIKYGMVTVSAPKVD